VLRQRAIARQSRPPAHIRTDVRSPLSVTSATGPPLDVEREPARQTRFAASTLAAAAIAAFELPSRSVASQTEFRNSSAAQPIQPCRRCRYGQAVRRPATKLARTAHRYQPADDARLLRAAH
jgi:hypothetical protein